MDIIEILAKKRNNVFQSEAWADFHAAVGSKSWVIKDDNIEGLIIKKPLHRLNGDRCYLYSPRGPVVKGKARLQDLKVFLRKVEALAKEEQAVFYRIEPYNLKQSDIYKFGFRKISKSVPLSLQHSPLDTLVLDIMQPEDKLLAGMKPKCRYNINLSKRKGVKVRTADKAEDIKTFYKLTQAVEGRGKYTGFDLDYYKNLYTTLASKGCVELFIAEHEGTPLAAILVSFYGQVATYLHGASGNEKRELMPSHALQWEAIKEAKRRNCRIYDFWGIAPSDDKKHSWAGITRFKKSFGGEVVSFDGIYDIAFNKHYYRLLTAVNSVRKILK